MANAFLDKVKRTFIAGAQTSATRIEEAARSGKLHLDLMSERRKLEKEFLELGKEAYMGLLDGGLSDFAERPVVREIKNSIERHKRIIQELEERIALAKKAKSGENPDGESAPMHSPDTPEKY